MPQSATSRLYAQLEVLKWLALIAMVFDHAGLIFYDKVDYHTFRIIGRLTWPILAWIIAVRLTLKPASASGYLKHLLPWALFTQPFYWLAFTADAPLPLSMLNIFVTIISGIVLFFIMQRWSSASRLAQAGMTAGALAIAIFSYFPVGMDYNLAGVLMIPVLAYLARFSLPASALMAGFMGAVASSLAMYAPHDPTMNLIVVIGPLLAGGLCWTMLKMEPPPLLPRLPRWFFYAFYPAHIIALIFLRVAVFPLAPTP